MFSRWSIAVLLLILMFPLLTSQAKAHTGNPLQAEGISNLSSSNRQIEDNQSASTNQYYYGLTVNCPYAQVIPTIDGVWSKGEWEKDSQSLKMSYLPDPSNSYVPLNPEAYLNLKYTDQYLYVYVDFVSAKNIHVADWFNFGFDLLENGNVNALFVRVMNVTPPTMKMFPDGSFADAYANKTIVRIGLGPSFNLPTSHVQYEAAIPMDLFTDHARLKSPIVVGAGILVMTGEQGASFSMVYAPSANGRGNHLFDLVFVPKGTPVPEITYPLAMLPFTIIIPLFLLRKKKTLQ